MLKFLLPCSFNVTENMLPFTVYQFQVSACNDIGCGDFTEAITDTTIKEGMLCDSYIGLFDSCELSNSKAWFTI